MPVPDFSNQLHDVGHLTQVGRADHVVINYGSRGDDEAGRPVRLLPPFSPPIYDIVGRDDLIARTKRSLAEKPRVLAFIHLPGVGKTRLADTLVRNEAWRGETFPDGVLWAHLGPSPNLRAQLRDWARALGVAEADMKALDDLGDWSAAVASRIAGRRMLLIVDDVWNVDHGRLFLAGADACGCLVTTRFPAVAAALARDPPCDVPQLTVDEGRRLLRSFAPTAVDLDPDGADDLVRAVDGLPLALVVMGHFLKQASVHGQAGRVRRALDALGDTLRLYALTAPPEYPEDTPASLANVVETSYRTLGEAMAADIDAAVSGDRLRQALTCLSVLRPDPCHFPAELAQRLLQDEARYRDALAMFQANGDAWDSAWVLYHLADALCERGDHAAAKPLCDQGLALGESERDPEVLALLQRVLGDIAAAGGDLAEAGARYAAAVRQAYRFQVEPEAPDAYTICFYLKTAERVARQLIVLCGGDAAALAGALFPAGLAADAP